jgi:hypothetical protein
VVNRRVHSAGEGESLTVLQQHAVFLSDSDEAELVRRAGATADVGELALRTCLCGARIDGFDAYWEHLRAALAGSAS